ncbi:monocarboxylate transporter 4-like [Haliotis asinina]|uniref:monocarboxylate transporter 4-like n=1 Tax=Haliotis asinina TaxID=109174 RepID=UPI003531C1D6
MASAVSNKIPVWTTSKSDDPSFAMLATPKSSTSGTIAVNKTGSLQSFQEGATSQELCVEAKQGVLASSSETTESTGHTEKPDAQTPELTSSAKLIVLISCICINFLTMGFALGLGVVFVQILDVFSTTRAQTSLMQSLCIGIIYTGAIICGPIVQKLGPAPSVILGAILSLVGCVGASFSPNVEVLIVTVGFITGFGLCLAYFSSFMVVSTVMTKHKTMGVSLITAGAGFGAFISPQLNRILLDVYGWRGVFLLLGGINFNMCVLGFTIRCLTRPLFLTKTSRGDHKPKTKPFNIRVFKKVSYTIFVFCQLPIWTFYTGLPVFIVDIAENRGYSLEAASLLLSAFTVSLVVGSLLGGLLDTVLNIPALLSSAAALSVCGLLSFGFTYFYDYGAMVALTVGHGILISVVDVCIPIILHQLCGHAMYSSALSFFFGISGMADICSGPVNGAIRDLTGDYIVMFYLAGGVALFIGLVLLLLELHVRRGRSSLMDAHVSQETVNTKL